MAAIYLNGFHGMIHLSRRYEWQIYTHISIANTHLYLCRIEWKCQRLIARSFDNLYDCYSLDEPIVDWYLVHVVPAIVYRASNARTNKLYWWWQCVRDGEKECKDHTHTAFPKVQMLLMTFNRHWFAYYMTCIHPHIYHVLTGNGCIE